MSVAGVIALSDAPRGDSGAVVAELQVLGVRTVMVTGNASATAQVVAGAVGILGPVWSAAPVPADLDTAAFSIFAGVLPEEKFCIVETLQKDGHIVGMCGDGANDAPARRQAHLAIAVSKATDVARLAAGIVLTEAGQGGVVASIKVGRTLFQRILTSTLRSVTHKIVQVLFLNVGTVLDQASRPDADVDGADRGWPLPGDVLVDRQCAAIP